MSKPLILTWAEEQMILRGRAEEAAKSPVTRLAQEIAELASHISQTAEYIDLTREDLARDEQTLERKINEITKLDPKHPMSVAMAPWKKGTR